MDADFRYCDSNSSWAFCPTGLSDQKGLSYIVAGFRGSKREIGIDMVRSIFFLSYPFNLCT